jgi:hypothetical protein
MQLRKTCAIGCFVVLAALAQSDDDDELRAKVATAHYPPLAQQARIQGDVRLEANSGVVTLVSGHPLLTQAAIDNARVLGSIEGQERLAITYHFAIVDTTHTELTSTIQKRGDAFDRAVLRMLGLKTEKAVRSYQCRSDAAPASDIKASGAVVEIWVYGRTFCPQPVNYSLMAKR